MLLPCDEERGFGNRNGAAWGSPWLPDRRSHPLLCSEKAEGSFGTTASDPLSLSYLPVKSCLNFHGPVCIGMGERAKRYVFVCVLQRSTTSRWCAYVSLQLPTYLSIQPSIHLSSVYPPFYLSIHLCLSIYPSISVYLSIHLTINLCLSLYLSVSLSSHPSICLSSILCLSPYQSIYLYK